MAKSSNLPIVAGRLDRRLESYNLVGFVRTGALYTSIELTFLSRNRGHFEISEMNLFKKHLNSDPSASSMAKNASTAA